MKATKNIELSGAAEAYAVANTPLFLLRKLRSDQAAGDIARVNTAKTIFSDLGKAVRHKPRGFSESVLPYVLLVALSYKRDIRLLRSASKIRAPHYVWYAYVANVLLEEFRPTVEKVIRLSQDRNKAQVSIANSTPALEV